MGRRSGSRVRLYALADETTSAIVRVNLCHSHGQPVRELIIRHATGAPASRMGVDDESFSARIKTMEEVAQLKAEWLATNPPWDAEK